MKHSISKLSLSDFRKYRINELIYKNFHENLKPYLDLSSEEFFKWIYTDILFYINNSEEAPHEIDDYYTKRYIVDGKVDFAHHILFWVFESLIFYLHSLFVYSLEEKEYVLENYEFGIPKYNKFKFSGKILFNSEDVVEQQAIWDKLYQLDQTRNYPEYIDIINDYEERQRLKTFVLSINHQKIPKTKMPRSMQWIQLAKNVSQLNSLHKELKQEGYIDCTLLEFKKIFSSSNDYQKIQWLGTDFELIYLYSLLVNYRLIKVSSQKWKQLRSCFDYRTENETSILSQLNNGYRNTARKGFFDTLVNSVSNS